MPPPLRIVHLVPGLPIGGAERMLEDLIRHVGAADATHTVLNLQGAGPMQGPLKAAGATVLSADLRGSAQRWYDLPAVWRAIGAQRPHIAHGWMYAGNLAALAACKALPTRPALVWGMHSVAPFWPAMGAQQRAVSALNRLLSAQADALVYVAHTSAQAHAQAGFATSRAHVIAGGVDTARFAPEPKAPGALRQRLGLGADARLIGMVARYHPMKAHDVLMRAAAELLAAPRAQPACHVLLVGAGFESPPEALVQLVPEHLRSRLHFMGPQEDAAPIVRGLDVCTLSSRQEALPKILLEAMASGVLCVATEVGEIPALLDKAGWTAPAGSPQALAQSWHKALSCPPDEAEVRRALGRDRIVAHYSQTQFASAMRALYQGLAQHQQR